MLVKITADNGSVGWGECVPIPQWSYETVESVTSTLVPILEAKGVLSVVVDLRA